MLHSPIVDILPYGCHVHVNKYFNHLSDFALVDCIISCHSCQNIKSSFGWGPLRSWVARGVSFWNKAGSFHWATLRISCKSHASHFRTTTLPPSHHSTRVAMPPKSKAAPKAKESECELLLVPNPYHLC